MVAADRALAPGRPAGDSLRRLPAGAARRRSKGWSPRSSRPSAAGTILTADHGRSHRIRPRAARQRRTTSPAWWSRRPARREQLAIREANMGFYCYRAEPFWKHIQELQPNNPAHEYYLTDMVEILHPRRPRHSAHFASTIPREVLGINDRVELAVVDRLLRERKVRELMLAGVTIEKPETVTVDPDVTSASTPSLSRSHRSSATRSSARTAASERAPSCAIPSWPTMSKWARSPSSARRASSAARTPGPFARLRMENHLGPGAHVGNFVELKKTQSGRRIEGHAPGVPGRLPDRARRSMWAPARSLATTTDTANTQPRSARAPSSAATPRWLRRSKSATGAYLAAGSVITGDVPADALGVARARQVNKEDWARKRRELAR